MSQPIWIFYTVISGLASLGFNYMNRYVLREGDDSTSYAWWFEFFRTLMFLPFFFFFLNFPINSESVILFLMIGLSEFFSVYVFMKMHSFSELSVSTVVSQMRVVWIPILAYIFLKEELNTSEYLGIFLVFVGQVVVTSPKNFTLDKGVKYALLSSLLVASNWIIQKRATPLFSAPIITVAMGVPSVFAFPLFMNNGIIRIKSLGYQRWKKILLATVFNAMTMLFIILAYKHGPVGRIAGLFQGITVLGVFIGIFLLNEKKDIPKKIIGSLIVVAGVVLLV